MLLAWKRVEEEKAGHGAPQKENIGMTQRERIREEVRETRTSTNRPAVGVYDTDVTQDYDGDVTAARTVDRVRWGPVIAGIFAAMATLATLTVLGLAIGLTAFDAGDTNNLGPFGLGAGIWGALSTLISFLVGGWLAARTAAVGGHSNGILNGAMVWFVAIPLLLYALGSGLSGLAKTAGSIAGTAVQAGATAAGAAANNPGAQATAAAGVQGAAGALQATAQAAASKIDSQDVNNAANKAANTAWSTLLALGLAAGASIGGGYLGSRPVAVNRTRRAI